MQRTIVLIIFVPIILIACCFSIAVAELPAGVQSGNWIEYNVTSTGALNQGHDVEWARMEVTNVQNPNVTVTITSRFTDGTNQTITSVLNLETGHLIDDFIIPANLNVGDSFKDENYGNITITGSETRTYAGAQRTILTATMGNNTYYWDQATGVSVEGVTETADYQIHSVASATNMWQPTISGGADLAAIVMLAASVLIIVGLILAGVVRYRHKKPRQRLSTTSQCSC